MKRSSTTMFILLCSISLLAGQPNQQVLDYIEQYKAIAVQEMIEYKIPASITMAQGILESGAGNSELAKESNNHFGIKCHTDWTGDKVYYDDDEKGECFRKYDEVAQSYRDHSIFLSTKPRYASLFELDADDYKGWAKGLKAAGYATNPKYADLLINLIEEYQLQELDKMTMADIKKSNKKDDHKKDDVKKDDVKKDDKNIAKNDEQQDVKEEKTTKKFTWGGYDADVYYFNRIPTVTVKQGETPESLANKHHVKISLLRDYNDIEDGKPLGVGEKCYLQPKRKKGHDKYHTVVAGETMWTISRDEGVRLAYLYKYNDIEQGQEPAVGEEVYLRFKRHDVMKLATVTNKQEVKSTPEKIIPKPEKEKSAVEQSPVKETYQDTNNDIYIDFEEEKPAPVEAKPEIKTTSTQEINSPKTITAEPVQQDAILVEQYHIVQPKETLYAISKLYGVTVEQIQQWNKLSDNNIRIGQQLIVGYK